MAETDGNNGNGSNGGMAGVRPFILILGSIAAIISFLGGQAVMLHWVLVRPIEVQFDYRIHNLEHTSELNRARIEQNVKDETLRNNSYGERIAYIEGMLGIALGDSLP